jgi:hypothetical protein
VVEAPTGVVTLVFTDVQGSTVLWDQAPDAMRAALALHDAIMRETLGAAEGYEVKTVEGQGDHPQPICTSHRQAKRTLAKAKASMKKHGINMAKAGKPLAFSPHKKPPASPSMRVFTLDGWTADPRDDLQDDRDELQDEINRGGPIQVQLSAQHFNDGQHDATVIGRLNVVLVRLPETYDYIENGVTKSRVTDPKDGLLGTLPLRVQYVLPQAGSGGVKFEGAFASPSGRVVLFGVQQWSFDAISGFRRDYQLPFAYARWDTGK